MLNRASAHGPLLGMSETHFLHLECFSGGIWCQLWRHCHLLQFIGYAITFFSWHLPDTAATWVFSGLFSPTRLRSSCSLLLSALRLPLFLKCIWLLCALEGPPQPRALFVFLSALVFITSLGSPSSHAKYKGDENNKLLPLAWAAAFPTHSLGRKVSFKGRRASAHSWHVRHVRDTLSAPRVLLWRNLVPAVKIVPFFPIYWVMQIITVQAIKEVCVKERCSEAPWVSRKGGSYFDMGKAGQV